MQLARWRSRSLLIAIALLAFGFTLVRVLSKAPRGENVPGVSLLLIVAVLVVPFAAIVVAWPRLARALNDLEQTLVANLKGKLHWRKRSRAQRRAEHRAAMKQLVIEYASRYQGPPIRDREDRDE